MHVCNCLVSVGGDVSNKVLRSNVSVPELILLQHIHGQGSVTEIEYIGNPRMSQLDLRETLNHRYPKFVRLITGIWQDNGGGFPKDVRKLNWQPQFFKAKSPSAHDAADEAQREAVSRVAEESDENESVASVI